MRGVSLAEIEDILERDYRTAQRLIRALGQCFPELEKVKDDLLPPIIIKKYSTF